MFRYILEIKNRIILLFITWVSLFFVAYLYKEVLLFLLLEFEIFSINEFKIYYFIFTDVVEVFLVYLELIFFINYQILIIYLIYHIFIFFSGAFFKVEYYYVRYTLNLIFFSWLVSIVLSKYILIPTMWDFFINFKNTSFLNLYLEAKLNDYLNFHIKFYYVFILYCQIFTILFFSFSYINFYSLLVKRFRKLYYYLTLLFATLVSPPEIFSQILISIILILFQELCIVGVLFKYSLNFFNKVAH